MDVNTFGYYPCCINLCSILNSQDNLKITRKVNRILAKQIDDYIAIQFIPNKVTRSAVLEQWHKNFLSTVNSLKFPENIRTHTLAVEKVYFRRAIKFKGCLNGKNGGVS
jgi:hypothetical protein